MSISSGEGTHVKELMRRTRLFLDGVEAEEAEKERLEMLRKAAMGGTGGAGEDEGKRPRSWPRLALPKLKHWWLQCVQRAGGMGSCSAQKYACRAMGEAGMSKLACRRRYQN